MKLIIGLGNPEATYALTRHNAGFLCLDFLQEEMAFGPFVNDKKMAAVISRSAREQEKVLLVKPQTSMNHSGKAVQALLQFYQLLPSDIVVIHDDIDIAAGAYRTTFSSRSAGHNGVQNVIDTIGTQDFFRIRLGIGRLALQEKACVSPHDFVLQSFMDEEVKNLETLFPKVKEEVMRWIS